VVAAKHQTNEEVIVCRAILLDAVQKEADEEVGGHHQVFQGGEILSVMASGLMKETGAFDLPPG